MRYQLSDLLFESDELLPELAPAAGPGLAETRVSWAEAHAQPLQGAQFSAWMNGDGAEWMTFADIADGFLLTFPEYGQFVVSDDASHVSVHPFATTPPETTRHLLLNQILPLVMSRRGRLVFHASAVSAHDRVLAFIGRSGGGKSTLAAACGLAGALIVSDDCLVVRQNRDGWSAVPCSGGLRLWPSAIEIFGWDSDAGGASAHYSDKRRFDDGQRGLVFETRELPLTAMLYLPAVSVSESPTSSLGPSPRRALRGRDAVLALATEVFRLDSRDEAESRRQFDAIGDIAARIPVEIVERQPPREAARALLCRMTGSWRRSGD